MNRALGDREKAMVAAARLAAHYVDAAIKAGVDEDEIGGVLHKVASELTNVEFWITDENGRIILGCHHMDFIFPDDPDAGSQAAPFASLLDGTETMVVQEPQPRELDGMVFQYVGVPGVDQPRIVQMGVPVGG
ncbi:MAG: hypothetical protein OXF01_06005 [Gemmatimonadetes bacterium]|nr:hypothetical protein [Gemmatimonadota bacterium]